MGEYVMHAITSSLTEGNCWNMCHSTKFPTCVPVEAIVTGALPSGTTRMVMVALSIKSFIL